MSAFQQRGRRNYPKSTGIHEKRETGSECFTAEKENGGKEKKDRDCKSFDFESTRNVKEIKLSRARET